MEEEETMTLDEASKIVNIWGIYLEHVFGKLNLLFGACIPESFLPFPKDTLEEALNIVAKRHHNEGNLEASKLIQGTVGYLVGHEDDEEAILRASKYFSDPAWRKNLLRALKQFQKEQSIPITT